MITISLEDNKFKEDLMYMLANKRIIPVIGSGFTRGEKTQYGIVPSGTDMKEYMIQELLTSNNGYTKEELISKEFSKIVNYYFSDIDDDKIRDYYRRNFVTVKIKSESKKTFLEIDWDNIYTLNIDDGIEKCNNKYEVIYANKELYSGFDKYDSKYLIKLHGDASGYKYKECEEWFILSKEQYIRSLKTNESLLTRFSATYFSKNILFIGCSLDDEIDILSKVINSKDQPYSSMKIYVTNNELSKSQLKDLELFGIEYVLKVDNYEKFYDEMYKIYEKSKNLTVKEYENYKNFNIRTKKIKEYYKDIHLLYKENIINDKSIIEVPSYYIQREKAKEILKDINSKTILALIGTRVSGKTYLLYNLIENIQDKQVYYFPSSVSLDSRIVKFILKNRNTVFIFDSGVLEDEEIREIILNYSNIQNLNNKIILTINKSDEVIIPNLKNDKVSKYILLNKFSDIECKNINKLLSHLMLPNFKSKMTLLDNIFEVEEHIGRMPGNISNKTDKIKDFSLSLKDNEIKLLILLGVKHKITPGDISILRLNKYYREIKNKFSPIIDEDYTELIEKNYKDYGYKIFSNAQLWILKQLGNYALEKENKYQIAYVIKDIVRDYRLSNKTNESNRIILFETLNELFPRKEGGAGELINIIYTLLEDILSGEPNYWIQRAKSILHIYNKKHNKIVEGIKCSTKVYKDITSNGAIINIKNNNILRNSIFTTSMLYGRLVNLEHYRNLDNAKSALKYYYIAISDETNNDYIANLLREQRSDLEELIKFLFTCSELNLNEQKMLNYLYGCLQRENKIIV